MKNDLTELVFILDRSGSMHGLEGDTAGGFNTLVEKQRQEPGRALVSTVLFDTTVQVLHDRLPLDRVPPMTERDCEARGSTALLDALGGAIRHIGNIHKYARPEDVPAHTLFVVTTDGMENASRHYTLAQVRQMVERQKSRFGWDFLFLGANIDAIGTAAGLGIGADWAANFRADPLGCEESYDCICCIVDQVRAGKKPDSSWKEPLNRDRSAQDR